MTAFLEIGYVFMTFLGMSMGIFILMAAKCLIYLIADLLHRYSTNCSTW